MNPYLDAVQSRSVPAPLEVLVDTLSNHYAERVMVMAADGYEVQDLLLDLAVHGSVMSMN